MPYLPDDLTRSHPSRPLPWLPWAASALFFVGLLALLATLIAVLMRDGDDPSARLQVLDARSNSPLANVAVTVDGESYTTDGEGWVSLPRSSDPVDVVVEHDGYVAQAGSLRVDDREPLSVELRPMTEQAALVPSSTSQEPVAATETPADRTAAPQAPSVTDPQVAAATPPPDRPATNAELAGRIVDAAGEPVQGALLTDGGAVAVTGADGLFLVKAQDFATDTLRVSAPGFADTTLSFTGAGESVELQLQPQLIKAIYYNPNISDTEEDLARLIDLVNTTEVNAIVVDVKEELIFYDSQVPFFNEVDVVRPIMDIPALMARFDEHDIYTIARHVVFKDSLVAERRPDLAVRHETTGEVWRDMNGVAWVNPMLHDLWDANIALAVELAELGFDEIQYDYVRFPTDGDLSTMDFGLEYNEDNRVAAITKLLERTRSALLPTGAKLSADIFGFTVLVPDDLGIGQDLTELAPHVDYLSPMVYPSHFPEGAMGLDGHPNDFPYETIEISMSVGADQLGSARQLRPWLQDFDFWDMREYGAEEVRAQIDAAEEVGASGWMLWDPNNRFTVEALGPDDGNMSRFESPAAIFPGQSSRTALTRRAVA